MPSRRTQSQNRETRDAEASRRADEFNRRQPVRTRGLGRATTWKRPCPHLVYCNTRGLMQFPPKGGYCRTCPSPYREDYRKH